MVEFYQPNEVDHFGKPVPELNTNNIIETDYRLFRYSKFALPWLIFMLGCGIVLFCLTIWQGKWGAYKRIRPGIPRDLEPWKNDVNGDGGQKRPARNLRFAEAITAIVGVVLVALIYYINPRPKTQRFGYYLAAFIIGVGVALAIIAFCVDVSRSDNIRKCKTEVGTRTQYCESRSAYGNVITVCDAGVAIFGLVCFAMLVFWAKDDTFKNTHSSWKDEGRDLAYENPHSPEELGLEPIVPGMDIVHKTLVFIGLLVLLLTAIMQLIFTILIHDFREKVVGPEWDPINQQMESGWPKENSRLRLSVSCILILCCLLSFVPYPKRVYVYVLAFILFCDCAMHFVIFALDVARLKEAKDMTCPQGVSCVYYDYNATCVFDFWNGSIIVIYLFYEFIWKHKQSTVTSQRELAQGPLAEYVPDQAYMMKAPGLAIEGPAVRPLLGVEVIEVEGAGGELNVTVMNVTPGGAAEEAGLRPGDVIAHWDEMPIHCKADFAQAVAGARIGSAVMLQVIRQSRIGPAATSTSVAYCKLVIRGVAA